MKNALINLAFFVAPSSLVTARHEFRHRRRINDWIDDDPFFIHVPKSGGTSIAGAYRRVESGHFPYRELAKRFPELAEKSAYYFILRDPVARILSTYTYLLDVHAKCGTTTIPQAHAAGDINVFVQRHLARMDLRRHYFLRPVSEILRGIDPTRTFAVNFDGLGRNLNMFLTQRGCQEIALPHANASSRRGSALAFDDRSLEVISDLYSCDIAMHRRIVGRPFSSLRALLP